MKVLGYLFSAAVMFGLNLCVMLFGWGLNVESWGWVIWGSIGSVVIGAIIQVVSSD